MCVLRDDAQVESGTMGTAQGPLMLMGWSGPGWAGWEGSDYVMKGLSSSDFILEILGDSSFQTFFSNTIFFPQ